MLIPIVAVALVAASIGVAMRQDLSGTFWVFLVPGICYTPLTVLAVVRMVRDGTISERLRPRAGDLTFGAFVAMMLFFGAMAGRTFLAPHGTPREAWLIRIYLQIGDPEALQRHMLGVSIGLILVAAMEEISWRGLVFASLEERLGTRRAWPATAALYAAAHLPTLFLLRDPFAGLNPLVVIAALGCGLVWGLLVARTGRLPVAIVSHALFTWCVVLQVPLWRLQ